MKHETRESWLNHAIELMRPMFDEQGAADFPNMRVSCGWPRGGRGKTIGQCWSNECSKDEHFELFISPKLDDAIAVLTTVMHEVVHAVVGTKCGHRGAFRKLALSLGFERPMTSTPASEQLKDKLAHLCGQLGKYPHARLSAMSTTKQTTRMLKLSCPGCGFICRTTQKWLDDVGPPTCACGEGLEDGR